MGNGVNDELISRQAAIDAAKHAWAKGLEPSQYIELLPPAQQEIIHCKDCIFRKHPDSFESHEGLCPFLTTDEWDDDFYCGYGERKDNG